MTSNVIERSGIVPGAHARPWVYEGAPSSGPSGAYANQIRHGEVLFDVTNGVLFVNEGTQASPYYTPVSFDQAPLFAYNTDFRNQIGKALSNTDAAAILASGFRVHGQGIAETDSGAVAQTAGEGGALMRFTTTDEAAHTVALSTPAGVFQPDQHELLVIDVQLAMVSAITERALFVGFLGAIADALDPAVTGATTVATLVQDDLAGLWMDSGLTDGDRLFGVHNKSDAAATQDLTEDGDTETDLAAAGTEQRFRVEINAAGDMRAFVNKVQVYTVAAALDEDEECGATVYLESNAASTKSMDVRRAAAWAYR